MEKEIRQIKTQPYLQAHCQSPSSHRNSQSFVKELANPTQDKIVFKNFPSPSEKIKNATHNPTKNSWTKTAKTQKTNDLTHTKDRRPACNNQRFVMSEGQAMKHLLNGTVFMELSNCDFDF